MYGKTSNDHILCCALLCRLHIFDNSDKILCLYIVELKNWMVLI